MADSLMKMLGNSISSDFTTTAHKNKYPAINPSRPELSQVGKTVLITGGSTGIGYAIAQAFIKAGAATVIIVARRVDVVTEASLSLQDEVSRSGSGTHIIVQACDLSDAEMVDALWDDLKDKGVTVDVLVLNAAKFTDTKPLLDLGAEEIWSQFEANVKGPIYMTDRFDKQNDGSQKFLVNLTSANMHTCHSDYAQATAIRPAYALTKASGSLFAQLVAKDVSPDKMQVISFHPGMIHTPGWEAFGVTKDMLPFDEREFWPYDKYSKDILVIFNPD
ncbi:putative galactose dehydrogenase GalD [Fusarium oxysporum f. sp. cubense]|uniref:Putative galactose dehydrogenase GalD n=1 Tax=Fusarium oxysporum f. sp. cubense TaxID=61366 RepID=A0A559LIB4_FUSOC|nr:putative galactose dehydrogenase GalD [Fusarium oxysporum f. sp. cubense]